MFSRPFCQSATYDPATLKVLGEIFDTAWASIEHHYCATSREVGRLSLAVSLLDAAAAGERDRVVLKCRAIGAMRLRMANTMKSVHQNMLRGGLVVAEESVREPRLRAPQLKG